MSSNAITENERLQGNQPGQGGAPGGVIPPRDSGPSVVRDDDLVVPRTLGMIGAALVIFSGMALAFNLAGRDVRVGLGWSLITLSVGLTGMLVHVAFERDQAFRQLYMAFGCLILAIGGILTVLPYPMRVGDQFSWAVPCLILGLLFLLGVLRNETNPFLRNLVQLVLGGAGGVMALVGVFGGNVNGEFLLPYGAVLALLGLAYLAAFVGTRGVSDDLAHKVGLGIGALGFVLLAVAVLRSLTAGAGSYFIPYGVSLVLVAICYIVIGFGMSLDWPVMVLTRRELESFFYSPTAYLSLLGFGFFSWLSYSTFLDRLTGRRVAVEPIVQDYLFALFPVFTVIFLVPVLTMRLLSEERRSGTLEVLLTAPVGEAEVVISKFLAAFLTYLVAWLPFGLFLLAIPLSGGNTFDYRPLFSFFVGLCVTGAGFISMGLFFSSLTSSQVASGVLTFAGMLGLTAILFVAEQATQQASVDPEARNALGTVMTHMSYLHVWQGTLEGKLVPRSLLFYLSMSVMCLFLTVKVLESRKWR